MANKMLIDASHPEETRVVVLRGNRVEEFDFESASRKQLRGNIYLAKVTRVEPSLQAAFVDYGGNRHGFLAFSEIHPDYYQIPVADRQALIAEDERAQRAADAEADHRVVRHQRRSDIRRGELKREPAEVQIESDAESDLGSEVETELDAENGAAAMAACSEQMAPEAHVADSEVADLPASAEGAVEATVIEGGESVVPSPTAKSVPIELARLEASSAAEPIPSDSAEEHRDVSLREAGDDITAPATSAGGDSNEIHPV